MTDQLNRCPHCWAALAEVVGPYCPMCARSLVKVTRRGRKKEATSAVVTPPSPPSGPSGPSPAPEPYVPYVPLQTTGYDPAPAAEGAWAAPAASSSAVTVLETPEVEERDPTEFPGRPLPPGFFSTLPERGREQAWMRPPRQLNRKLVGVAIGVAIATSGAITQVMDRNEAIDSPAHHLVAGPCTDYREISLRLGRDENDIEAQQRAFAWMQSNLDKFEAGARLDPQLEEAASVLRWFHDLMADPARAARTSTAQFNEKEVPLREACTTGPGRA